MVHRLHDPLDKGPVCRAQNALISPGAADSNRVRGPGRDQQDRAQDDEKQANIEELHILAGLIEQAPKEEWDASSHQPE